MKQIWSWFLLAITAIGGGLGYFLGGMDGLVYALIACVVLDWVTGLMCAVVEKKLSSEVGFRGIFKKVLIFAMVAVGHMADMYVIGPAGTVGDHSAIRTAVILFYLSNEGLSLFENSARLGLPIPEKLKSILAQLHGKSDGDNNTLI